jgi:hypothetical protein
MKYLIHVVAILIILAMSNCEKIKLITDKTSASIQKNNNSLILFTVMEKCNLCNEMDQAFKETLDSPDIQKKMIDQGADPAYLNPEQFTKFLTAEMPRWAKAVKQAGAKID